MLASRGRLLTVLRVAVGMASRSWLGAVIVGTLLSTSAARAVVLRAGEVATASGETVEIAVTLDTGLDRVAGTQNDIELTPPLHWAPKRPGFATCAANPAIGKGGTTFGFARCASGGDCERVRAIVLAFDNVDPIADGSELYRCRVAIDSDAPGGVFPVPVTNLGAADPEGNALVVAGVKGRIVLGDIVPAVVQVDDATIFVGDFSPLAVRLVNGSGAATVTVDLVLSDAVHIISGIDEAPHCSGSVPGLTASFAFEPAGCPPDHHACATMRAIISSPESLPADVVLFECTLYPVPVIDRGSYVADCSAEASDASGAPVAASCQPGTLRVLDAEPPPTPTPSPTGGMPPDTPTGPDALPTPTAALRATATLPPFAASSDDDGCQVAPPAGAGSMVLLFGPGAWLFWHRRRGSMRASRGRLFSILRIAVGLSAMAWGPAAPSAALTPTPTPTPMPTATATCAPTGTPYCATQCEPCPTIRAGCFAQACGACRENPVCAPGETCAPVSGGQGFGGCCVCAPAPTPTPAATPASSDDDGCQVAPPAGAGAMILFFGPGAWLFWRRRGDHQRVGARRCHRPQSGRRTRVPGAGCGRRRGNVNS